MSIAYEIPQSWQRPDCTELCWQRFVQIERGKHMQVLTYHDLAGHRRAWERERAQEIIVTGPLTVDDRRKIVSVDGRDIPLTSTEYKILRSLADRIGEICSHAYILTAVWGAEYVKDSHLLRVNISRLRAKLGPAAILIVTRPNEGFILRSVEPCRSDAIPAAGDSEWRVAFGSQAHRIGFRQKEMLRRLEAVPDHRLSMNHLLMHLWGSVYQRQPSACVQAVRRLQTHGYPVDCEVTDDRDMGWVWLTDAVPGGPL